jgi:ferrous iron transport protein A
MFTPGFSGVGSSLRWMQIGERGTVNPFRNVDERTRIKLERIGIRPGASITVEQRSPRFMVRVGGQRLVLSDQMIHAVTIRLSRPASPATPHYRAIAPISYWGEMYSACELNLP